MEILKRARNSELEVIPSDTSLKAIEDEVNRRSARAGYTTRLGEPHPNRRRKISAGWSRTYEQNYLNIFGSE